MLLGICRLPKSIVQYGGKQSELWGIGYTKLQDTSSTAFVTIHAKEVFDVRNNEDQNESLW